MAKDPRFNFYPDNWDALSNKQKRTLRVKNARCIGTHSREEWIEMLDFFEHTCCCCMESTNVVKDHIIPVYQGGSDSIANLQPLCRRCNSSKGADTSDWRPQLADQLGKTLPSKWLPQNG